MLTGPKGRFALGRVAELGAEREFQTGPRARHVAASISSRPKTWTSGDLREFLAEHLASLSGQRRSGREASAPLKHDSISK